MKKILFAFFFFSSAVFYSQENIEKPIDSISQSTDKLGLKIGLNYFGLQGNQFETQDELGFNVGLIFKTDLSKHSGFLYGIDIYKQYFSVEAIDLLGRKENVKNEFLAGQIHFSFNYSLIPNHLSIFTGPAVQFNSKLDYDNRYKNHQLVAQPSLSITEFKEVNRFNFIAQGGIMMGLKNIQVFLNYQYGLSNFMAPSKDQQNPDKDFTANASTITAGLVFYLN
ncbi:hypothetical protein ACFSQ0_09090 [Mesonia sediminis]|uniref:Outer membrane protein beta-barrel domain-containing protein n=1 Tax=Mesonia sediminis TaxID=1703946 RepID=A0ABW5SG49_9FLAO